MKKIQQSFVIGCSVLALAGCGGDKIVSPGTGGDIIVNNPTPTPTGTPTPTPTTGTVTPAGGCPTIAATGGLRDDGTITGPTGTYRVCVLPAKIDASTRLQYIAGVLYAMDGRVDVGTDGGAVASSADTNVTLTVEPGVILFAGDATNPNGESYLVVNRGNKINAVGTADMPIVFTSRDNVLGLATDASIGQWGGVVLLGRAPVSDCRDEVPNKADQAQCEQELEGAAVTTLFGGNTAADSSGTMDYFQIRYSGFTLTGGSELQSLTTGGIGSGTSINHFMSFNSSDDGMEFFGGTVKMKHVIAVGADDDAIDVDTGAKADLQYVITKQRATGGDHLIELDSPDGDYVLSALPRTNLRIANATLLGGSTVSTRTMRLRGAADFSLVNSVVDAGAAGCLRIDEVPTIDGTGDGPPKFSSVVMKCGATPFEGGSGVTAQQVADLFNNSTNTDSTFTVALTSGFINSDAINGYAVYNANTNLSSFFDVVDHIGAVKDAADDWWAGWTCDSATLTFGDGTGSCTRLPVY
ncbi:hypothetical protein EKN06_01845 [Croceicoccus ponticola]|uniref:Serine/threonine protein kinase n=1 Tax=Croceicoccus ponticola TaxID=2217664 RepID=A0A437H081_9SPHN|nr:hypothetical protein [Croceicoccus ponticola]RVQ68983.1 hypothetical protein EKN06_01845 [Croceicoccus ponticola]